MNNKLRIEVKQLKLFQNISYKELSQYLEISYNGFCNWLKGYYDLGAEKQQHLQEIINTLRE